ncbi:MAG: hypothetical protein P8184_05865 [Calditrichia bacterium]
MKIFFIISFIFLIGCTNPFGTREPDKPRSNNPTQPINSLQNYPDSLLAKFKYAFGQKDINYYMQCLADSTLINARFVFIPQQNESYRLPFWTREDEFNYFNRLINNKDINNLLLQIYNVQDWTILGASQDTMQTRFSYEIEIDYKLKKEFYRGQSIFKIVRSPQTLWYVYFWEDLQANSNDADSTWSTLKANYR